MKKSRLFTSTLIAASFALSVSAWADSDGTKDSPLSGSISELNPDNYTGTDGVVYIQNITGGYWAKGSNNALTISSNLYITYDATDTSKNGITFNNGYSDTVYTFTGSISGDGNWTFNGSGISQQYIFLGDMSGYSGNIDYSTERASDDHPSYFYFGNGGQAATDTNVSGTGSITQHGNITYNYSSYATIGDSAITIGNSSLKAETIEFAGSVNYTVNGNVIGYDSSATLTISNTGTTTFNGTVSGFGTVTVDSGSTLAVGTGGSLDLTGATVDLSSTIQNSGTVTIGDGTSFVLDNLTKGTYGDKDYYVIVSGTGTVSYSGNISFTHEGITLSWDIYNEGGYFVVYGDHISELTWAGTGGNNTWSTTSTDESWSSDGGTTADSGFNNGDSVTFSSSTAEKSVIVSGAVEATSMTVSEGGYTFSSDSTSGGTIKANSFTFNAADGTSVTIAVSDAEFGGISLTNHGDDKTSDNYKALVFGNGTDTTTATVTGTLSLLGQSEVQVAANSTLTVNAITSGGGYHTSISGGGTLIATSITQNASGNVFDISIANLQVDTLTLTAGTLTFSGGNADIGSLTFEQGTLTFTGGGTYNIGTYQNSATDGWVNNSKTLAIGDNTTVTAETFSVSWHETVTFGANSVLTVTGELSLHTNDTETFSGGTINAEKLYIYNGATASFSNGTLNIGSGGIVNTDNWTNYDVVFGDGLTVGVYAGTGGNTSWSTDVAIHFTKSSTGTGTTFYTEVGQSITLSGSLSGAGFSNTGAGMLTLSGTVSLSSEITNSGTIIVDSNITFVLDNLKSDGHGTYVIISNVDSGTIQGWDSLSTDNFYFTDGTTITSVDVTTSGQITISTSAVDLIWNGGSGTWDTSSSNWTGSNTTFSSGDRVTFTGSSGDTNTNTITVQSGGVYAAYVTVEGGKYSFTGSDITVREYFVINSGAEVDLDGSVVYADFVVNGTLKLDVTNGYGDYGEVHGTITINNGGRVELDNGDVTGYGDGDGVTAITINKGGTLYVGTTSNQTLGSCDLILVGGTIDGVDGSNLDLFHSSTLIAKAAESATAEDPTVSTIKGAMLTSRNDDGTTEVRVEENAVLLVESGFWSGPGGTSVYNDNIEKTGAGTLEVSGYFAINTGSLIVDEGTVILSGTAGGTSNNYGFAGAITVAEGAVLELAFTSGDATVGSVTSSGTLKITGTSLTVTGATSITDLTLDGGSTLTLSQGNAASNTSIGTLTVSGATAVTITGNYYEHVSIGALAGSGTLVLGYTESDDRAMIYELTGTSSFSGTIDLTETNTSTSAARGVTLIVSSEKGAAGAVIEMGTNNSSYGALALGVNAKTVEIAGLVSTSSHNGSDIIYSGSVSIGTRLGNAGASLIDYASEANKENFTGVGTSRNTLVINTAEGMNYSFSGVIMDKLNLEKSGAGTQSIEFQLSSAGSQGYYFDGTIAINGGTLNLSGVDTNSAGITVAADATLNIANKITLAATSDITSVTSTISGTLNIESGGQLDLVGTVTINNAISNAGTITIADGTSIVVGVTMQEDTYSGSNYQYYELITGSGDGSLTLGDNVTFVIDGTEITLSGITPLADSNTDWKGYVSGGSLYIYTEISTTAEAAETLYWAGTDENSTWSTQSTNTPWSATDGGQAGLYFADEANVIFGSSTATVTTVTVEGEVVATTTTINGAYTFDIGADASVTTGTLTIAEGGSLALTGEGKIVTGAASNSTALAFDASGFTGEMDFTKGYLDIANSTFNSGATVVVTANTNTTNDDGYLSDTDVSLHIGNAESNSTSEFAASLVLEGDGGVIIRTGDSTKTVTFLGSVTGTTATLQLNGGGNAVFSGTVNVGTYLNFQGATTFSGATTLGKLEFFQNGGNASDVTFSGSTAKVTALVVDQSGGSLAANLTVENGASLEVGTMTIDHNFAITIDKAAMSITGTVTQADNTTTTVTISDGGQLSLGNGVTLNVDVMNIVLSTENYDANGAGTGTYAIVGDTGSSLTFTTDVAITITVDSALETLLSNEGTYYFDISNGIVLSDESLDYSALESYGTVDYSDGILSVVVSSGAIPEPSMFGVFFGIGALGLVATRRRRRKVA